MQTVFEILQSIGVFLAGALARFGIVLVMVAVIALPALAIALVSHAVGVRRARALHLHPVRGILVREGARYAPGHTWLAPRKTGSLQVGIDDLAQRLVPSVTAVELPRAGDSVKKGEVLATLHGGGRAVPIASPISGRIVGVNASVLRDPGLVKREGYGKGWLVAIAPEGVEWAELPGGAAAEAWMDAESVRFARFLEERLGVAAADGGELVAPAPWLVGEEGWKALASAFLKV
jgi:glycine cleavage system H lipoate-binding protein